MGLLLNFTLKFLLHYATLLDGGAHEIMGPSLFPEGNAESVLSSRMAEKLSFATLPPGVATEVLLPKLVHLQAE